MPSNSTTQCHHIKTNGTQCNSPALRDRRYCYFHQRTRPALLNLASDPNSPSLFSLPPLEDAHAIQFALRQIMLNSLAGLLNDKKVGLMLYALQIASSNLKNVKAEIPAPEQIVVDLPARSEPPRPTTNGHIYREEDALHPAHVPEPGSAEDEYYDDIDRQAREVRETLSFQIHDDNPNTAEQKEQSANLQGSSTQNDSSQHDSSQHDSSQSASNDDLPPGTFHACIATPPRQLRRFLEM